MRQFKLLSLDTLRSGCYQPRRTFDEERLQELAQSIRTQGLIEPLIVREITPTCFEILAGERRWRAAKIAGLKEVPCLIGIYSDQQAAALTLIENTQRENLNLIEEAYGYQRLQQEFHFTQEEIAQLTGKSRPHITNILRLLSLCQPIQSLIIAEQLSLGHARVLIGLSPEEQIHWSNQVLAGAWSVRKLEAAMRHHKKNAARSKPIDKAVLRLQHQLADQVGAPVEITEENQGGWLKIKFFDNETLSGLLDRLGLRYD